jgi:sugar phosphate isomerase/epimerase
MEILRRFDTPLVCYWHDIGHAHVRDRLGFSAARLWIEKLAPRLGGMHVHDAVGAGHDHLMPPLGEIDFAALKAVARSGIVCVLEPTPSTPVEHVQEGLRVIGEVWDMPASGGGMP